MPLTRLLEFCGQQGKWVLPLGLIAGISLPWAAEPMRRLIPLCIAALLFLSVLRLLTVSRRQQSAHDDSTDRAPSSAAHGVFSLITTVLIAQLALPVGLYFLAQWLGMPWPWIVALTLVAAASPISGSPNLVQLLGGDDALALRWLILGTAMLPLSCLPVMVLLFPDQSPLLLLIPSLKLLALIASSVISAYLVGLYVGRTGARISPSALDGAASLTLALMVIGLMSALHDPGNTISTLLLTLCIAFAINYGLQILGFVLGIVAQQNPSYRLACAIIYGNRNIALYLAALPISLTEPLLLFIACYQIPMYLTPLLGGLLVRRYKF